MARTSPCGHVSSIRPSPHSCLSYWPCCRHLAFSAPSPLQGETHLVSVSRTVKCWERCSLHLQIQESRLNVLSVVSLTSLFSAEFWLLRGHMKTNMGEEKAQNLSGPSYHHIIPPSWIFAASIKTNQGMWKAAILLQANQILLQLGYLLTLYSNVYSNGSEELDAELKGWITKSFLAEQPPEQPPGDNLILPQNYRMVWVVKVFKDHLVSIPLPCTGNLSLDHVTQSPIQPGFEHLQSTPLATCSSVSPPLS